MLSRKFLFLLPILLLVDGFLAQSQDISNREVPIRGRIVNRGGENGASRNPIRPSSERTPVSTPRPPAPTRKTPKPIREPTPSSKVELPNHNCRHRNGYETVANTCEQYIECKNNIAYKSKCHSGLYYDSLVQYPHYPCNFPSQVSCRVISGIGAPSQEKPVDNEVKLYNYNCKHNNYYEAVPNKCDYFVRCVNNEAYQVKCPGDLYFDNVIQYPNFPCTYASQVKCPSHTVVEPSKPIKVREPIKQKPIIKEKEPVKPITPTPSDRKVLLRDYRCRRYNAYEVVPNKCNYYIECANNNAYEIRCPSGLNFDADVPFPSYPCKDASEVSCDRKSVAVPIEAPSRNPTGVDPVEKIRLNNYSCKNRNGYEAVPNKCYNFIECDDNVAYKATCPEGLHFDNKISYPNFPCNYDSLVVCIREKPTTVAPPSNGVRLPNYNCRRSNGYEVVPNKCEKYVECIESTAYETKCPSGRYFDDSIQYPRDPCTYDAKSNCPKPSTVAPPSNGVRLPNYNCRRSNGYEIVPNKCEKYIECIDSTAYETKCPSGRYFDDTIQYPRDPCNYAAKSNCPQYSTAAPPSNGIRLPNYSCRRSNGYEVVPNKCELYVECINSAAYETRCPSGLYFDSSIQYPRKPCTYAAKAECDRNGSGNSKNPSPICSRRNMYVPVEGQCDLYTECKNYEAVETQCPDGLHFNPNAIWPNYPCEYPQYVQCKGRGVAQPPVPTADCPEHQYGYMISPLAAPNDCRHYRVCVGGKAIEMFCPVGLAFNEEKAVCDWPSDTSTCNSEAYIGFTCPPASFVKGVSVITNHRYDDDCYAFYSCMNGQPRILSCDPGLAFNPDSARCEDASLVDCAGRPS